MLVDLGSRDPAFLEALAELRTELLALAEVGEPSYAAIPMQGSGTFALESALGSVVDKPSRLLILSNGAYGDRLAELVERLRLAPVVRRVPETAPLDPADIAAIRNEQP